MTLTQLSNVFNEIAQAMPELNNYHFGFLSDIDINILNNFNPSPKCQTPYPMALFEPPSGSFDPQKSQSTRVVDLWIVDRQQGDKQGTTCETLVEKMSFIEEIGNSFLRTLKFIKIDGACLKTSLKNAAASTELDGYQFKDRLVTYKMTFSINTPIVTNCVVGLELDTVQHEDLEIGTTVIPPFPNKYSMFLDGVNEYMDAPSNPSLTFSDGLTDSPLTMGVWMHIPLSFSPIIRFIFNKRRFVGVDREYNLALLSDNKLNLSFTDDAHSAQIGLVSNLSVPINQWVYIAITYNGTGLESGIKIYFDGVNQATTSNSAGSYVAMQPTTAPLTIGKAGWASSFYFGGSLNQLFFYKKEFSESEVQALSVGGKPIDLLTNPNVSKLVFWSRMGDGDFWNGINWELYDNSINSNTLTSTNMELVDRVTNVPT